MSMQQEVDALLLGPDAAPFVDEVKRQCGEINAQTIQEAPELIERAHRELQQLDTNCILLGLLRDLADAIDGLEAERCNRRRR